MDTDWKHIQSFHKKSPQKRLYIFSISIFLISLPCRGFYCEAISLFWDGSRWRARRFITFWYCLRNKDCINKNNSVLIKFIPINILKSGMRIKRFSQRQIKEIFKERYVSFDLSEKIDNNNNFNFILKKAKTPNS